MFKLIKIILLGGIGLLYSLVLIISYLLCMLYLLITEIIGTKKFIREFKQINTIIMDEFKEMIETTKSIFELV